MIDDVLRAAKERNHKRLRKEASDRGKRAVMTMLRKRAYKKAQMNLGKNTTGYGQRELAGNPAKKVSGH